MDLERLWLLFGLSLSCKFVACDTLDLSDFALEDNAVEVLDNNLSFNALFACNFLAITLALATGDGKEVKVLISLYHSIIF